MATAARDLSLVKVRLTQTPMSEDGEKAEKKPSAGGRQSTQAEIAALREYEGAIAKSEAKPLPMAFIPHGGIRCSVAFLFAIFFKIKICGKSKALGSGL